MKTRNYFLASAVAISLIALSPGARALPIWINEIHYDDVGTDASELVEIAGAAGTSLSGYSILLYNGADGSVYGTINLSGIIGDQQNGFGTLSFARSGIQNGAPDGIALVGPGSSVLQFLSYEGTLVAAGGAANGMTSVDIGASESDSTPNGTSLQLIGSGTDYVDFSWSVNALATAGTVNSGQSFAVPEGGSMFGLLSVSLLLLYQVHRLRRSVG